ncbi:MULTISPECIES: carbohydrate ABC transporter permease [Cohnella]|uniref:carbohydrate ABC transporter permease n=1 Tax=Cohnella TaxID=329857 RepID=UPI0009B99D1A|nr:MULTISPECIES: carbohydrate ABC transporter permease [Cohnella]MBN2980764.1 carbohydrate ABC transporter permease [Cohnella algarum]
MKKIAGRTVGIAFIVVMIAFTLYPVAYTVFGSLKSNLELQTGGGFFPTEWKFSNYAEAFQKAEFLKYTGNSVLLSAMTMLLSLVTSSMAGYVVSRHDFAGKKALMAAYLSVMFVALGPIVLYPQYMLMKELGLTGNLFGLALVLTGGQASNIFLIMGFIKSVPKELDESALMDGAGYFRIYRSILLPLIRPILGVIALFSFRLAWNDYITSLVFSIPNPGIKPLTVAVVGLRYSANAAAELHIMTAGAAIAIVPILIVYLFANRQFINGLTAGAVKG